MIEKIRAALEKLDVENDSHWTDEGLPRLSVMKELLDGKVGRNDIEMASPNFSRESPTLMDPKEPEEEEPEELGPDAAAEIELKEAREDMNKAKFRLNAANEAMDVIILRRGEKVDGRRPADDIKAYQKSQQAQAVKNAAKRKAVIEAMAEI